MTRTVVWTRAARLNLKPTYLVFILVMGLSLNAHAAEEAGTGTRPSIVSDLWENCSSVFTKPKTYGGIAVLLVTPEVFESESSRPFRKWIDSRKADAAFEYGNVLGNPGLHLAAAATLFYGGKLCRSDRGMQVGSDIISAQIITGAIALSTKVVTRRTRPDGAPYSFPSGHSSTAFATAGVVLNEVGIVPGLIAEGAASYVALSRLQENKHFISDVVAGALVGNYIAYEVSHRQLRHGRLTLAPALALNGFVVDARLTF